MTNTIFFINGASGVGKSFLMEATGLPIISTSQFLDTIAAATLGKICSSLIVKGLTPLKLRNKDDDFFKRHGFEMNCRELKIQLAEHFIIPSLGGRERFVQKAWRSYELEENTSYFVEYFNVEEYQYHKTCADYWLPRHERQYIEITADVPPKKECKKEVIPWSHVFHNNRERSSVIAFKNFLKKISDNSLTNFN